jgi:hypothetical protein
MPDHACDRGAVRLDPGASRSQAYRVMTARSQLPMSMVRIGPLCADRRRAAPVCPRTDLAGEPCYADGAAVAHTRSKLSK